MVAIDPAHRLTSSYEVADLADFAAGDGPFVTVVIPSPSEHVDSADRLAVRWGNARRMIEGEWNADHLADLDAVATDIDHDLGDAVVLMQRADGVVFVEHLGHGVAQTWAAVSAAPRSSIVIDNRQRTLPHIVVDTDRAGATISGFDAGSVVAEEIVEGDTEHIHRGHPGGFSQRRFQQRAENTWEDNADDVAGAVRAMAATLDPIVTVIAGDVRARHLVADGLDGARVGRLEILESGSIDAIADDTIRLIDDEHVRLQRAILDNVRSGEHVVDPDGVVEALAAGRVDVLLVHDPADAEASQIDRVNGAIGAALRSGARVVVAPPVSEMSGGLAASLRW